MLSGDFIHGKCRIFTRNLGQEMYSHRKKTLQTELSLFEFKHPFGTALDTENRWVRLATLVPWAEEEEEYSRNFGVSGND